MKRSRLCLTGCEYSTDEYSTDLTQTQACNDQQCLAVLVLSSHQSSNTPMLVNFEGKSRSRAVSDNAMHFELSQYFKIVQGWSTVIWSSNMGLRCPLDMDVELPYVVKCGILAVPEIIHDR